MILRQSAKNPADIEKRAASLESAAEKNEMMSLVIEVTSTCNLVCTFCDLHALQKTHGDQMKPRMLMKDSVFEELITQLKGCSFKFKEINMHGVGEPLMNKNILKQVPHGLAFDFLVAITINRIKTHNDLVQSGGRKCFKFIWGHKYPIR